MPRFFPLVIVISMLGVIAWLGISSSSSYDVYREVKAAKSKLEGEVHSLKAQLEDLEEERTRLAEDASYYDQLGREELGMIRPDEMVYIVELRD